MCHRKNIDYPEYFMEEDEEDEDMPMEFQEQLSLPLFRGGYNWDLRSAETDREWTERIMQRDRK